MKSPDTKIFILGYKAFFVFRSLIAAWVAILCKHKKMHVLIEVDS